MGVYAEWTPQAGVMMWVPPSDFTSPHSTLRTDQLVRLSRCCLRSFSRYYKAAEGRCALFSAGDR
jgi:hypothetical protein